MNGSVVQHVHHEEDSEMEKKNEKEKIFSFNFKEVSQHLDVRLSICPSVHLLTYLSVRLSSCLDVHLLICPSVCPSVPLCLSTVLSVQPFNCLALLRLVSVLLFLFVFRFINLTCPFLNFCVTWSFFVSVFLC
jgi:hypothetical protein